LSALIELNHFDSLLMTLPEDILLGRNCLNPNHKLFLRLLMPNSEFYLLLFKPLSRRLET